MSSIIDKLQKIYLPINQHLELIISLLSNNKNLILQAEPGAGKTSLVPLALLTIIPNNKKIILLEPRRLAARSAALRMAAILDESIGMTVGYRIKNETRISSSTRIEVITEGILTRMLQSDPELESVALIIFDEFHERSLDADLGLALALEVQQNLRDDLKLLIMSATLNISRLSKLLVDAPQVNVPGKCFPVITNYLPTKNNRDWPVALIQAINLACDATKNDILVFLPGIAEINKASQLLKEWSQKKTQFVILPLYGDLVLEQQLSAMKPIPLKRKIILATNIAETSITIEGVDCVIDSGLVRLSQFDPNVGFDRLMTQRISLASATQRAGRAGRLAPGTCYRLWPESESLRAETIPEILRADLATFSLELSLWGVKDSNEIGLIDQPNIGAYQQAKNLLVELAATKENNQITPHGRQILSLAIHPRFSHMLLESVKLGAVELALLIAVVLEEKDILQGEQRYNPDFLYRLQLLISPSKIDKSSWSFKQIYRQVGRLKQKFARLQLAEEIHQKRIDECLSLAPILLAMIFPDRIAKRRGNGYLLANGSGAILVNDFAFDSEFLVVIRLGGQSHSAQIYQAIPISKAEIDQIFTEHYKKQDRVYWDEKSLSVKAVSLIKLSELTLSVQPFISIDPIVLLKTFLQGIKSHGIENLPWLKTLKQWQARIQMLYRLNKNQFDFPDVSNENLLLTIDIWLTPYLNGLYQLKQINENLLSQALKNILTWDKQQQLEKLMPEYIQLTNGSKIRLDYCLADKPVLEVKLQEMFGEVDSPKVASGQISILLHLLSPARRPLQITENLASFWNNAYLEVKKEMKGRYPKHPWPDDPLTAIATRLLNNTKK